LVKWQLDLLSISFHIIIFGLNLEKNIKNTISNLFLLSSFTINIHTHTHTKGYDLDSEEKIYILFNKLFFSYTCFFFYQNIFVISCMFFELKVKAIK